MQRPRLRFSVRRLIVAVAIVGILLGVWLGLERRRERFRELSDRHEVQAQLCEVRVFISKIERKPEAWLAGNKARFEHHLAMMRKYQQAARRPWLPVAPDPPEPK
jgi:hypothetical protein